MAADISVLFDLNTSANTAGNAISQINKTIDSIVAGINDRPIDLKFRMSNTSIKSMYKSIDQLGDRFKAIGNDFGFGSMDLKSVSASLTEIQKAATSLMNAMPKEGSALFRMSQEGSAGVDTLIERLNQLGAVIDQINAKEFKQTNVLNYTAGLDTAASGLMESKEYAQELLSAVQSIYRGFSVVEAVGGSKFSGTTKELRQEILNFANLFSSFDYQKAIASGDPKQIQNAIINLETLVNSSIKMRRMLRQEGRTTQADMLALPDEQIERLKKSGKVYEDAIASQRELDKQMRDAVGIGQRSDNPLPQQQVVDDVAVNIDSIKSQLETLNPVLDELKARIAATFDLSGIDINTGNIKAKFDEILAAKEKIVGKDLLQGTQQGVSGGNAGGTQTQQNTTAGSTTLDSSATTVVKNAEGVVEVMREVQVESEGAAKAVRKVTNYDADGNILGSQETVTNNYKKEREEAAKAQAEAEKVRLQVEQTYSQDAKEKAAKKNSDYDKALKEQRKQEKEDAKERAQMAKEIAEFEKEEEKVRLQVEQTYSQDAKEKAAKKNSDYDKALKEQRKQEKEDAKERAQMAKEIAEFEKEEEKAEKQRAADSFLKNTKTQHQALKAIQDDLRKINSLKKTYAKTEKSGSEDAKKAYKDLDTLSKAYENLYKAVESGDKKKISEYREEIAKLKKDLSSDQTALESGGVKGGTIFDTLKNSITSYASYFTGARVFMAAVRGMKQMVNSAIEMNTVMSQLQIVTKASDAQMAAYADTAFESAKKLGVSANDFVTATTTYARLGNSIEDASKMAGLTTMLQTVGDIDAGDAQSAITAIVKAYDVGVNDLQTVMDKLVAVGNGAPISVSELATGMNNAGSALAAAGNDFDKSVALLTAANTTAQDASKSSTALRTITARIRNTKTELDEMGETMTEAEYNSIVEALTNITTADGRKLKVSLTDANGELRSTYDIIADIAVAWKEMDVNQRAALAETLAATRNQNVFISLMDNFDEATKALGLMENASDGVGELAKSYDIYLSSTAAHIEQLKAAFDELSTDLIDSDLMNFLIDAGKKIIEGFDGLVKFFGNGGILGEAGLAAGLFSVGKGIKSIFTETKNLSKIAGWSELGKGEKVVSVLASVFPKLTGAVLNAGDAFTAAGGGIAGLQAGASAAVGSIGTLTAALSLAGVALAAIGVGVIAYKAHMEKLRQAALEDAEEFSQVQSNMDDYIAKVRELRTALDEGNLSEAEAYEAKKNLFDIQNSLIDTYGQQAAGIDLVNGSLDDQIAKMQELTVLDAQRFLNKNATTIDKAEREMTKTLGGDAGTFTYGGEYLGSYYDDGSAAAKRMNDIIAKYDNITAYAMGDEGDRDVTIRIHANATDAEETLNSFMSDLRAADKQFGEETYIFDDVFNNASSVYQKADNILTEYKAIYEQALRARMIDESFGSGERTFGSESNKKTAAQWLNDYSDAVKKYNDALSSGDTSKIAEARAEFKSLDSVISGLLSDKDGLGAFSLMFERVRDSLNESAIAADTFKESTKRRQDADYLNRIGMTEREFATAFIDGLGDDQTSRAVKSLLKSYAESYGIEFGEITIAQVEEAARLLADIGVLTKNTITQQETPTPADIKTASENTLKAITSITNAQKLLSSQSAGLSVSPSDMSTDEMKEYISAVEYSNGVYQLNAEKVNELVQAKANEQIAINEATKAMRQEEYLKNAKQIEEYQNQLKAATANGDKNTKSIEDNIAALREKNLAVRDDIIQIDLMNAALLESTSAYQQWLNSKSATQTGDMFDGAVDALKQIDDVLNNKESDMFGRVGRSDYQAAVDFIVPDSVDKEDANAVRSYIDSVQDMFTKDSKSGKTGLNIDNFVKKAFEKKLLVDDGNGGYNIAEKTTMNDFAEKLNLSLPLVRAMFGEMQEFGAKFDWSDEADQMSILADRAEDAAAALKKTDALANEKFTVDVSQFDDAEKAAAELENTINLMNEMKATPGVDTSDIDKANQVIEFAVRQMQELNKPMVMNVNTGGVGGNLGSAIDLLQKYQEAKNNLEVANKTSVGVEEATADLDSAIANIEANHEIMLSVGLDTSTLQGSQAEIDAIISSLNSKEALVDLGVDSSQIKTGNTMTVEGVVNWTENTNNVTKRFTATGIINWRNGTVPPSPGSGSVNGSANVNGTANASGDWRSSGGRTLVGELGREIVVDPNTGRWYTVGDNGAEFANIPKDAIVFNHRQSDALLKYGKVAGRGAASVNGSAFVTGSIPSDIIKLIASAGEGTSSSGSGKNSKTSGKDKVDWIEVAIDRIERAIDKLNKIAESAFKSLKTRLEGASTEIDAIYKSIEIHQRAYDRYLKEAEGVELSEDIKELVRNGTVDITGYNSKTKKLISEYQDWYEKAIAAGDAVDDLHESLAQLYQDNFDNMKSDFENQLSLLEHQVTQYENRISITETAGYAASAKYYQKLSDIARDNVSIMQKELTGLQSAFDAAMASGEIEEGSQAWYDMKNAILDVKDSIDEANESIIEYANNVRDINWGYFDTARERINELTEESEFLIDLLGYSKLFDDNGSMTDSGMATVGLMAQNYNVAMAQAESYSKEILKLDKEIANDPYNTVLLNRRKDLLSAQRESIIAAQDEKEAIKDLISDGVSKELEAMKKLIDKYTDALDSAKDLYDYQKKIGDSTSNISSLQKQIAAYSGDTSESAMNKVQKLQVELDKAQESLRDTEYDRYISDQKKLIDDMYSEYEETLNKRLDEIDSLIADSIESINNSGNSIRDTITSTSGEVGYTISDELSSIWSDGGMSLDGYISQYGKDFSDKLTTVNRVLYSIERGVIAMAEHSDSIEEGSIPAYKNGGLANFTGFAKLDGSASRPEVVLKPEDSANLIALRDMMRKMSSADISSMRSGNILNSISAMNGFHAAGLIGAGSVGAIGDINITIPIDKVVDYNDLVNKMRSDGRLEQMIVDMTIGKLAGGSSLAKNKYRW